MLKSDDASFYNSSSPDSDSFSENHKNIDTVSKLFSSLLKNPESAFSIDKTTKPVTSIQNDLLATKEDHHCNELSNHDCKLSKSLENFNFSLPSNNSLYDEVYKNDFKAKRSLAASSETIIIDHNHNKSSSTPFNSKIPVLHSRSDPLCTNEEPPKQPTGLQPVNDSCLKKICSISKIPVSTRRPNRRLIREPFTPFAESYYRWPATATEKAPTRHGERSAPGRYTHVKSKLAAYINRPTKTESHNKNARSKSPTERRTTKNDPSYPNMSGIKRLNSRTSLDTFTCDYKAPLSELDCLDCAKTEDVTKNYQRAREHFELAMEHNKIKAENEKVVAEHQRIITKHRQLMFEHEEKANEHTLKAIAHVLNRIT